MAIPLEPAPESASEILDKLVDGLVEPGQSRVLDNTGGTFMAVHVSFLRNNEHGRVYSVAHYYEAQGDLVADPDMELLRDDSGWYPHSLTIMFRRKWAFEFEDTGERRINEREYCDQLSFLSTWMRNIQEQQEL